jgi:STAS domain
VVVAPGRPVGLPGPAPRLAVSQLAGRTGLRLSGEADLCTVDILKQAIAALPPGAAEIHLQLASLEFIDVAAARELVMLTARPARPRLVLHYPPPALLTILRLCWPETRARLSIGAARPEETWTARPGAERRNPSLRGTRFPRLRQSPGW